MQIPLQVTFRNMEPSEALEMRIREKVEKIDTVCENLMGCRVIVEAPHRHQQKGGRFHTRIDLTLPGQTLVINRNPDLHHSYVDVYVSIRDAFDSALRKLQEHARRQKGQVKRHESLPQGSISVLYPEEDYGRIVTYEGDDIYFHRNSILNADFDSLEVGTKVSFVEQEGDEGPQASSVKVLGK